MSTETYQKDSSLRKKVLKVWLLQGNLSITNLRSTIRQCAPFANPDNEEKWMYKNVPNYYQLRRAELSTWDDEHIKKVLKGAGFAND